MCWPSLIPPLCNIVPNQESEKSGISMLMVLILRVFTICLFDFRTVDSMVSFFHFITETLLRVALYTNCNPTRQNDIPLYYAGEVFVQSYEI